MTIIGSAYVEIRALDTNLRRDIDNAMKKIKDVTLNIKADVNLAPVRTKISELRSEIRSNPLKFETEVDDSKIIASLADAHQLYKDNPLQVESHTDTSQMETALQTISERFRNMDSSITPHANTARAEAEIAALDRRRTVTIPVHANTARAEAEIDTLSRRRSVTIHPNISFLDSEIKGALSALSYTMMGAVPAPAIKAGIIGVLSNIEQLSVSAAKMSTIVGSAGASLLTLGANAFSVAGDLSSVLQIAAVAPAAFSGLAISLVGAKIAWKGFAGAFSSNAKTAQKAMAQLPTEAQAAVKAMKGLWTQITKPAQKAFWVEMGTSLQDTVKNILPAAKTGFIEVETSLAKMTKGVLASFNNLKNSGGMDTLFNNVAKGLDNASRATTPFFDAINRLSVTGSKFLPVFGDYLAKSADKFNAFITKADEAGKINVWIDTAVTNLKALGSILGSSGSILKGLTIISDMSGGKGLGQMANGLKGVADVVNSEPFRSRLVFVLEGARKGAEALGEGFGKVMDILGRSTIPLRNFLKTAGEIGGAFLENITKMFDGTGLGDGFQIFIEGVKTAMENLGPTFTGMGKLIGDFGRIAGIVLVNMVPGLNNLFETLSQIMGKLVDGIVAVIPIFNDFVQNILVIAAPIAIAVADALGQILKGFAGLPKEIQSTILIFGLLLAAIWKFKQLMADTSKGEMSNFRRGLQNLKDGFTDFVSPIKASFGRIGDAFATAGVAAGYAKDAVGKAFTDIRDSARITGSYIADGFKKSMSDAASAFKNSSFVAGAKEFGRLFKDAILPGEVQDGFNRLGARIENGIRDAVGKSLNAMDRLKEGIKNVFPPGQFVPALKELPKEIGGIVGDAAARVTDATKAMAGKVYDHSIYASKHLSDIGQGFKNAAADIKAGTGAVANDLRAMGAGAVNAYNGTVLAAATHPLTAPFVEMAAAAKVGFGTAGSVAGKAFSAISDAAKTAFSTASVQVGKALSEMAVAGSIQGGVLKDKLTNAASETGKVLSTAADGVKTYARDTTQALSAVASPLTGAFRQAGQDLATVGTNLKSTFSDLGTHISTTAQSAGAALSSNLGSAMTKLKENFGPAGKAISEGFSGLGAQLAPARTALSELGQAAGGAMTAIGREAKAGLKGAASGLLDALGGPFGLAIGGATAAIGLYAQSIAESKANTEALAKTLDQTSGKISGATKNLMATNALDGATNQWDDFVRGVVNRSKSVEESLGKMGVSTEDYTNKLTDPKGRDAYVEGLQKITKALNLGKPITDEMAKSIGTTKEALKGVNGNDMMHLAEKASNAAEELKRAEEKVQSIAKATGTSSVEAQILSKNFDVLASTTSTAAAKFTALKENLDMLNRSSATNSNITNQYKVSMNADKAYAQSLDNTKKAIQAVRDENDGLVNNLYTVGKGFDFTSQAGRDLHTALEGQTDAILKLGTEAMDKALKGGKSTQEAQKAAISAMTPGIDSLKASLKELGFAPATIDEIVKSFGLVPDNITTALGVTGGAAARQEIFLTTVAADAFKTGNYQATLAALPDAAKKAIEDATGMAGAFKDGKYDAILTALDKTDGGRQQALLRILAQVGPNAPYEAYLTALDRTGPGVDAAGLHIKGVTNADYSALIKAKRDGSNDAAIEGALAYLSRNRSVSIGVVYTPTGDIKPPGSIARPGDPIGNNGGLIGPGMSPFSGKFPMGKIKAFANGGIENHIAQISRGQTPFRVWSEPETGGEAYIPLSPAKRPRSLKILEEVAKMFGFSLYKQFASGGLSGFDTGPKTAGVASTGSLVTSTASSYTNPDGGSNAPNIVLQVNPSAALDEEKVGKIAASELYWQFINR